MNSEAKYLEADYLIVGAGAMGMAFADVIVAESQASVMIVDRHDAPGGHWNDAYPFLRLHSASATYGVNSTPLGEDTIDSAGLNRGFLEHASAAEICSYYDRIMRKRFLRSGRVHYFPLCDYQGLREGDGRFVSLTSGTEYRVHVKRKIVDATFTDTAVPSRHPPKYSIAPGVRCVSPNALPAAVSDYAGDIERYVVIGAGKTGIDVCLWLLERGVSPERIAWIMPRDSWLLNRAHVQPRPAFFAQRMGAIARQVELIQDSESVEHLFQLLHRHGYLLRIDERFAPPRFRCATVSQAELAELRRIDNVVRLGHVQSIDAERIVLDQGVVPTDRHTLHVDCTAGGIHSRDPVPVFAGRTITLQAIRTCQQCFSAALIAHLELNHEDEADKNRLTTPIPLPNRDVDWLRMFLTNLRNQQEWMRLPELRAWIANSRLDLNHGRTGPLSEAEEALLQRFRDGAAPAAARLAALLNPESAAAMSRFSTALRM